MTKDSKNAKINRIKILLFRGTIMEIIKEKDRFGGEYYKFRCDAPVSKIEFLIDELEDVTAMFSSFRSDPFWMQTKSGVKPNDIPRETQWLATKNSDNSFSVYYSLACTLFRTSFFGADDGLYVSAMTGDTKTVSDSGYAMYKLSGDDFYELVRMAARSICEKFNTTSLRETKPVPKYLDQFGWCTWDSFYHAVSDKGIAEGLKSFKDGDIPVKFLIIDDGWQTINEEYKEGLNVFDCSLSEFVANQKFGDKLLNFTGEIKKEYGVENIFVWHALIGYWNGVDVNSKTMQSFNPERKSIIHPVGLKTDDPDIRSIGMIDPQKAYEFYSGYHKYLNENGIDGVKVDAQSLAEATSEGTGSRCELVGTLHTALEKSVNENLNGKMINCMSSSNDIVYHIKDSNMMRTSGDFMPQKPETHIKHIYDNAINSIWLGEFTYCDWDMFQTTHEYGEYHAASRAICGGPIYVSDKVGVHNFDVIKALITDDGYTIRSLDIAKPTLDCLFLDISSTKAPFKIFNKNIAGGVIGVFSSVSDDNGDIKTTEVNAKDICGFSDGEYAVYSYKNKCATVENGSFNVSVKPKDFDILTFAPIKDGFAIIGAVNKYNSGAVIRDIKKDGKNYSADITTSGEILIYSKNAPKTVTLNGEVINEVTKDGDFYTVILKSAGKLVFGF